MNPVETISLTSPIGLVAGNGQFPLEFIKNARQRNLEVVMVAHRGETDPELEKQVSKCLWIRVGQIGKTIRYFKKNAVKQASFVGGIKKTKFISGFRPDLTGLLILAKLRSFNDDALFRALSQTFENKGICIFGPSQLLEESIVRQGRLTKRQITKRDIEDAAVAWDAALGIGTLDIGQTVVAKGKVVIAVEAVEGTDSCIRRAADLAGDGCTVVKISKPGQDLRIDMPVIGSDTIEVLKKTKVRNLILQADKCMILDPITVVRMADENEISILAVSDKSQLEVTS